MTKKRTSEKSRGAKLWFRTKLAAGLVAVIIIGSAIVLARQPIERQRAIRNGLNGIYELVGITSSNKLRKTSDEVFRVIEGFRSKREGPRTGPSFYGGSPRRTSYPHKLTVLENEGFTVGYCEARKNPVWVCYRLFAMNDAESPERPDRFRVDKRTDARVSHDDYSKSGYDRGHLAPNFAIATRYGADAQLDTFMMSNICPQRPKLNQQVWRELEDEIANEYAQGFEEVWVITGPIFDDDVEKLESGVEIPGAFYKVVVDEQGDKPRVLAFIVPQSATSTSLKKYLASVDEVEEQAGFDFLADLEDTVENELEGEKAKGMW